ncbi:amidohydrolase family protein, partial [Candidatus Poribacteria bacterium]|nr:amidohydrolase family protein [Candidatus Poribacteria bacterium]
MLIDSHVHLKHGDADKTEYTAAAIVETMDAVGIDKSIVFAMSTTTRRSIEMARAAVDAYPDRLIPYVYALPNYERPVLAEIDEAISARGFKGIKIHVGECTLAEYVVNPVLRYAGEHGVPCLIDVGGRLGALEDMLTAFPETTIIVAHLGRYLCREEDPIDRCIDMAERHENLVLDVSGVVLHDKIVDAVRRVGSARVTWGTDGPHLSPDTVGFARKELDPVRDLPLTDVEESDV